MAHVTRRLVRRIERDFPRGDVNDVTRLVADASQSERVQAAIVLAAGGDSHEVIRQAELAQIDWRDVLVNGGMTGEDWASVLDEQLGR